MSRCTISLTQREKYLASAKALLSRRFGLIWKFLGLSNFFLLSTITSGSFGNVYANFKKNKKNKCMIFAYHLTKVSPVKTNMRVVFNNKNTCRTSNKQSRLCRKFFPENSSEISRMSEIFLIYWKR